MTTLPLTAEFFPMNERDLDDVTAIEAEIQLFPWSRGNFSDSMTAGHSVWVCRLGGDLIGFAIMMSVIDEAHLLNIGISPRYQGRGYGARMLRHIMSVAKSHGASKLFLEVRPSNEQAVSLYRHFGFRQIGLRRGYYPAAIGREDGLVFDKDLA